MRNEVEDEGDSLGTKTAEVLAKYPSYAGSYLYPYELFLGAAIAAIFIFLPASAVRRDAKRLRAQKLQEINE